MVDRCVPNISRMSSIYESDPPPSNKMSTNANQIRPILRAGAKDESNLSNKVSMRAYAARICRYNGGGIPWLLRNNDLA